MKKFTLIVFLVLICSLNKIQAEIQWVPENITSTPFKDNLIKKPFVIDDQGEWNFFYIRNKATGMMDPPNYEFHHIMKNSEGQWITPEILSSPGEKFPNPPNVSIALSPDGDSFMAYFGQGETDFDLSRFYEYLVFKKKTDSIWVNLEHPVEIDTTKRNSDLSIFFDDNAVLHMTWRISWFDQENEESTEILYARYIAGDWEVQHIEINQVAQWRFSLTPFITSSGVMHYLYMDMDGELRHVTNNTPGGSQWDEQIVETGLSNLEKISANYYNDTIHLIVEGFENYSSPFEISYLEFYEETWHSPEQIEFSIEDVILLSTSISNNGDLVLLFAENEGFGVNGDLYIAKRNQNDEITEELIYPSSQVSEGTLEFDSENNLLVFITDNYNLILLSQQEEIQLYEATFIIVDDDGETLTDAMITLDGYQNPAGNYTFEDLEPGNYSYTVSRAGYYPFEDELTITDQDVEIEITLQRDFTNTELFVKNEFKLFPNPASNLVNLSAPDIIYTAIIFDNSGRIIKQVQPDTKKASINISDITPGIYFLTVETAEGSFNRKIIISKQ